MNRFTTPEEVFGPVSIKALKEDSYIRKTAGYLPTADFAFLDEIWKSSPAILNSLLTLINEHIFKNGDKVEEVPLKALISASNEVPEENQGLDALYDRFIVRLIVPPISDNEHFNQLINSKPSKSTISIENDLIVGFDELETWKQRINDVTISDDCLLIIKSIRQKLSEQFDAIKVYASDRRWQRAAILMKASAFFNDRAQTNHSDAILLKHCLWTSPDNHSEVEQIVMDAIKECGFSTDLDIAKLDAEKDSLDKEINKELYHSQDVYETVKLGGKKQYFSFMATFDHEYYSNRTKQIRCYIPQTEFKSKQEFQPVDNKGNIIDEIRVTFDNQGSCRLTYNENHRYRSEYKDFIFTPKVLFNKGDKKEEINERLIMSLAESVSSLRETFRLALVQVQIKLDNYHSELASPFATETETKVALNAIENQIEDLQLRIQDCERLESLCQ
jgi:MoxR-like ATPase